MSGQDQLIISVETLTGGTADRFLLSAGPGQPVAGETAAQVKTRLDLTGINSGDQDLSAYATIAGVVAIFQPLNPDLTAIAALSTTSFGRALLALADAAAARTAIGAGTSSFDGVFASLSSKPTTLTGYGITDAQPLDNDLTAIAALTTTSFGRGLLALADAAALRSSAGVGTMSIKSTYVIQVALSGNGQAISSGTKKGVCRVPFAGTITGFLIVCDPANEPSAAAVQVDLNTVNLSTGATTSVLSSVASIATGANVSTGGAISGSPSVAAGDLLAMDIDQGSDGKELVATITITAT